MYGALLKRLVTFFEVLAHIETNEWYVITPCFPTSVMRLLPVVIKNLSAVPRRSPLRQYSRRPRLALKFQYCSFFSLYFHPRLPRTPSITTPAIVVQPSNHPTLACHHVSRQRNSVSAENPLQRVSNREVFAVTTQNVQFQVLQKEERKGRGEVILKRSCFVESRPVERR